MRAESAGPRWRKRRALKHAHGARGRRNLRVPRTAGTALHPYSPGRTHRSTRCPETCRSPRTGWAAPAAPSWCCWCCCRRARRLTSPRPASRRRRKAGTAPCRPSAALSARPPFWFFLAELEWRFAVVPVGFRAPLRLVLGVCLLTCPHRARNAGEQ